MNDAHFVLAESLLQKARHSPVLVGSGVLAFILLIAVIRVVFFARRHSRRHHGHHWWDAKKADKDARPGKAAHGGNRRQRRRQRTRLNPTLAEKGGLPPARNESTSPPPY